MQKSAIVTGAAGFTGSYLMKHLLNHGYRVCAILRPNSEHNKRICSNSCIETFEIDVSNIRSLCSMLNESYDYFFHLAWHGKRDDFFHQMRNVDEVILALETARIIGCKRFVCTGSQAEYGLTRQIQDEKMCGKPFSAYGAAKLSACYLSSVRAKQIGIEWVWGRIFSVYGENEPQGRMLSDLVTSLQQGKDILLSSCVQNWDYLDADDAAEAIIALAEKGKDGEIYNVANGNYRPLKNYVEIVRKIIYSQSRITYGDKADPFVSLQPSVEKIRNDTGWYPRKEFMEYYCNNK